MRTRTCLLVLCLASAPAFAGYDEGIAAYRLGDYSTALAELRPLADQGNAEAQWTVGLMYAQGSGVLQDYVQAHMWLNLAAARGHREAAGTRESIAKRMTAAQIGEAQRLARAWRPSQASTAAPAPAATTPALPPAQSPTATTTALSNREVVRRIQASLGERGYDPGPADGLMGSRTRSAIRKYEGHQGLRVTGQATRSLLAHLDANPDAVAPGSWADTRPPPSPTASAPVAQPPSRTSTVAGEAEQTQALVDELRELIAEGERRRTADGSFLRALDDLAARYDANVWSRLLLDEKFQSVTEATRRGWQVTSGEFEIRPGTGLQSLVEQPAPRQDDRQSAEEQALALLGAIIGQAAGGNARVAAEPSQAEIHVPLEVSDAFRVVLVFRSLRTPANLQIGIYRGSSKTEVYDVAYRAGGSRDGVELVRTSGGSQAVVARHAAAPRLEDGRDHRLEWTRDRAGQMQVALDGRRLIDVTERGVRGSFSGIRLRNFVGEMTVSSLSVHGTR